MKLYHFFFLFFFLVLTVTAQDKDISKEVKVLEVKIEKAEKGEKLFLLDSLAKLTFEKGEYNYPQNAQNAIDLGIKLDSLNIAIRNVNNLVDYYNNVDNQPDLGLRLFKSFLGKATLVTKDNLLGAYYLNGGDSHYFMNDAESSLIYYERAEYYAMRSNNQKLLGLAKLYVGMTQSHLGFFGESSVDLQRASAIFTTLKDTFNIISAKNALSILYSKNGFFVEAENERNEAIRMAEIKESYGQLVQFYFNAATDAQKMGNEEKRIDDLLKAREYLPKSNYRKIHEPSVLAGLVIAYSQNSDLILAQKYLNELNVVGNIKLPSNRPTYIDALKHLSFARKNYKAALKLGEEHLILKKESKSYEEIQNAEKFLSDVYTQLGDDTQAFVHFKNYYTLKDSILNQQNTKALGYYQTLYEIEKKDRTIKSQEADIELLAAKSRVQNQLLLFGGLGLVFIFGLILLYRSRFNSRKSERLQRQFSQDLISAQEAERTRVSRELHDSVGQKLMLLTRKTKMSGDAEMQFLAGDTLDELRSISRGLHPSSLERIGITAAVVSLINEVDKNTNIFFTNEIENIDNCISKERSLHLYRIIQEVLTNIVKHSEAKAAFVTIKRENQIIETTIVDNGKGFDYTSIDKNATSLGMKTLLERSKIIKSRLDVTSEANKGTTIAIITPIV